MTLAIADAVTHPLTEHSICPCGQALISAGRGWVHRDTGLYRCAAWPGGEATSMTVTQEEHETELEDAASEAYENGRNEGEQNAEKRYDDGIAEGRRQLAAELQPLLDKLAEVLDRT